MLEQKVKELEHSNSLLRQNTLYQPSSDNQNIGFGLHRETPKGRLDPSLESRLSQLEMNTRINYIEQNQQMLQIQLQQQQIALSFNHLQQQQQQHQIFSGLVNNQRIIPTYIPTFSMPMNDIQTYPPPPRYNIPPMGNVQPNALNSEANNAPQEQNTYNYINHTGGNQQMSAGSTIAHQSTEGKNNQLRTTIAGHTPKHTSQAYRKQEHELVEENNKIGFNKVHQEIETYYTVQPLITTTNKNM